MTNLIGPEGEPRPGMQAYYDAVENRIKDGGVALPDRILVRGILTVFERSTSRDDLKIIKVYPSSNSSTGFPEPVRAVHGAHSVPVAEITDTQLADLASRGADYASRRQAAKEAAAGMGVIATGNI